MYKFNATFKNIETGVLISFFVKLNAKTQFEADKNGIMVSVGHLDNPKNYLLTYYKSEQDEQK